MRQGRFAEAATLLSPLAVANPRAANTQYRLGVCLWRTHNLPAAAEAFRRAHLVKPKEAIYTASLARVYVDYPNYERASYWYRKLLLLRPGDMRLTTEAARYAMLQNRPLEAELLLKRALAKKPTDADGWMLLAGCYQQLGLKSEAAQCLEKAVAAKPPQLAQLRQIIRLYVAGGEPARALPYLQMASKLKPGDAVLRMQTAECYLAVGNPKSALVSYRQAVKLAPRNVEYRLTLAKLLATDDPAGALREYDLVSVLTQPSAELLLTASALATKAGDQEAALRYLTRLVALKPAAIEPRELLVQAALAGHDQAVAVLQWRELQRIGSRQYASEEAELALKLGAREWALRCLQQAAPAAQDDGPLCARLASMFAQLDNAPQAIALAQRALQKSGADTATVLLAAQVLLQAGDIGAAEAVFRQVHQEQPVRWTAVWGLGTCLLARRQARAAYDLLQGALKQKPRDYQLTETFVAAADALNELPQAATVLTELAQGDPADEALLEGLAYLYRRLGGPDLAARRLLALSERAPANGLWALTAARELLAADRWRDAAAIYERLAKSSEYTVAARTGLCQLLLAQGKDADLLGALARLTGPQAIGPEAYKLLLDVRAELVLQTGKMANLGQLAAAASAVCLSDYQSESYYLGMADLYLATKQTEAGVGYLQAQATTQDRAAAAAVGLARLLRKLDRATEARVWLDQAAGGHPTPAATLERANCLLAIGQPLDAAVLADTVLQTDEPALMAEAHLISAAGCLKGYRPEESLWHYCQALRYGAPSATVVDPIIRLCSTQPLSEIAVLNAVQQLYAEDFTDPALEAADALSQRPGFGQLKQWLTRVAGDSAAAR